MNYVIQFGKRLYLSKNADYVNNMTHLNIRVFKEKDRNDIDDFVIEVQEV